MKEKLIRFYNFMMQERTKKVPALIFYCYVVSSFFDIPTKIFLPITYFVLILTVLYGIIYMPKAIDNLFQYSIKQEAKKIGKEIIIFLPINAIFGCIFAFFIKGESANNTAIIQDFEQFFVLACIDVCIITPILEEYIFRKLPYCFIKNKKIYIFVATIIFATMHVVHDPKALYYIWPYLFTSFYFTYRYYKTQDLLVTISLHSCSNILATISLAIQLYF